MNSSGNTKDQLIKKQELYIRQLEEQLAVYEEKDKAQELLIENLNRALVLFAEEISDTKAFKEEKKPGAQPGHPHHPRRPRKPDQVVVIPPEAVWKWNLTFHFSLSFFRLLIFRPEVIYDTTVGVRFA